MNMLEQQILEGAKHVLEEFSEKIKMEGYDTREPSIDVRNFTLENYSSELCILFIKNEQIEQVIEFQIFDKGKAEVTFEEAMNWIRTDINDILP